MQIWAENTNARGGLLGRPVKLIHYDDQSNPALVPGIYTKLLDIDHIDLVVGGYATNTVAPAMPVIIAHNRTFLGLLALAVNSKFHYKRYFSIAPTGGPNPKESFSAPFFAVATALNPRPQTLAIVGADAEFPKNAIAGALAIAKRMASRWCIIKATLRAPRISAPSFAPFRPPIRIWFSSPLTRQILSAWCAQPPKSG
jgi:branched-chain amino acid transport system substrate-binding protein